MPTTVSVLEGIVDVLGYHFRVQSQLVAYVDESSARRSPAQQEYLVCAAIIDVHDLDTVRRALLPLRLLGQIKLHWTDERSSRRRRIIETLSGIDSMQGCCCKLAFLMKTTQPVPPGGTGRADFRKLKPSRIPG